jgi:hypothetical protein
MVVKNKSKEESLVDESVERAVFGKTRKMHRVEGRMRSLTFQWKSWVSKDPNREVATREKRLKKTRKKCVVVGLDPKVGAVSSTRLITEGIDRKRPDKTSLNEYITHVINKTSTTVSEPE